MLKRIVFILPVAAALLVLASQEALAQASDDQRNLPLDRKALVNVVPVTRDFAKINQQHKILMAVIDTGVDYNHPRLQQNIHFQLDAAGKPVGLGWDFTGNDAWPAPLVANSLDLDNQAPPQAVAQEQAMSKTLSEFLKVYPQFKGSLDPQRNAIQEIGGGLFHGTHVAGLMTYDEPRLGLLAYRALPFNIQYLEGRPQLVGPGQVIVQAIAKAIQDGARVINLSLGVTVTKELETESPSEYQTQLLAILAIKELANKNPQVAFVAATGNEGAWLDDRARLGMPCGIEAPNILCVGATDSQGGLAPFSNIVLPDYPFILASGEEIISLYPTQFCDIPGNFLGGLVNPAVLTNEKMKLFFFSSVAKSCSDSKDTFSSSGTSMATPIVSRLVGKAFLGNPKMSGAQAIQQVLASAEDFKVGRMVIRKLKAEKPTWYSDRAMNPRFLTRKPSKNFEFFSK